MYKSYIWWQIASQYMKRSLNSILEKQRIHLEMLKDLNRSFIKEDTSVSNKRMKRCSAS